MKAAWTIMIYMNVEPEGFDIGFRKNQWEMSLIGSNEKLQVITIVDRNPSKRSKYEEGKEYLYPSIYRIEKGVKIELASRPLKFIRNEDMGSPKVLEAFLKYCIEHFPAEKYMLSFWDHGAGNGVMAGSGEEEITTEVKERNLSFIGRRHFNAIVQNSFTRIPVGNTFNFAIQARVKRNKFIRNFAPFKRVLPDTTDDYLYAKEICSAIQKSFGEKNKIDIIAFDACWMQTFENAYTFKDCAKYMVASENLISLQGFGYYMFLKHLTRNSNATPLEVATILIKSCYLKVSDTVDAKTPEKLVEHYYNKIYDDSKMTLSCVDLTMAELLAERIDKVAKLLEERLEALFENIRIARFLCLTYFDEEDPADYDLKVVDLIYFLKKLSENLITALNTKDKQDPDIYSDIIATANEIAEIAEMNFVVYKEMGFAIREEKEVDKRWGTHGFSIFFPEHFFEWQMYKDLEGWYFETNRSIQIPFARENNWKKFLEKYFVILKKHVS
jgi:hypothetical protein